MSIDAKGDHLVARSITRWLVHLGLLLAVAGAIVTLVYLGDSVTIHVIAGLVFVGLVVIHLIQRRRTIAGLASQLARTRSLVRRASRQAASDTVLTFLVANVFASGLIDWVHQGMPVAFPLPNPLDTWHRASSIILVAYLIPHVWNRRRRLRRSVIR